MDVGHPRRKSVETCASVSQWMFACHKRTRQTDQPRPQQNLGRISNQNASRQKHRLIGKVFSSIQTGFLQILQQGLLGGSGERNRVALIHPGISPDYNHLFCLYSACLVEVNTVQRLWLWNKQTIGTNKPFGM